MRNTVYPSTVFSIDNIFYQEDLADKPDHGRSGVGGRITLAAS
jgi:hypothetical protein